MKEQPITYSHIDALNDYIISAKLELYYLKKLKKVAIKLENNEITFSKYIKIYKRISKRLKIKL